MVKLLESAKSQGKYQTVLEGAGRAAHLGRPRSAQHRDRFQGGRASRTGLSSARQEMTRKPGMQSLLQQDIEDLTALQVTKTPTFLSMVAACPASGQNSWPRWWPKKCFKAKK